jgi:hypothetical protein
VVPRRPRDLATLFTRIIQSLPNKDASESV